MKIQKHKLNQGFTIIEVLIVLAIAGLILAIVFLAVPALQRNTRNNGRINDIARVGAAINNWVSNNNGSAFPNGAAAATITAEQAVINDVGNLSQYTATANGTFTSVNGAHAFLAAGNLPNIVLNTSAQCGAGGATVAGGGKQMAIQYMTEGGAGDLPQCLNI